MPKARVKQTIVDKISKRLVYLAKSNLKEIEKTLNLLHVIEAEVIQRIHIAAEPNSKYRNKLEQKGSEWMSFPVSDDEIWVDEIDKFQVQVKNCPGTQERKKWASK